jgi:hypothetical protein
VPEAQSLIDSLLEDSGKDWSVVIVVDGLQKENTAANGRHRTG